MWLNWITDIPNSPVVLAQSLELWICTPKDPSSNPN